MVEKQTMKLKLDQHVIQKGRMAPKNTGLGKDDLQDMVNYGADAIFEIGSDIDDEDIEKLIQEGEEKARNLQNQAEAVMKEKFDMINFEMNTCNLYQFEDVDYQKKRKEDEEALKKNVIALMDAETNLHSRRKQQQGSLAENKLFPNIFANGSIGVSAEKKKKEVAKVADFRFYPNPDRLRQLIETQLEAQNAGLSGQGMWTPEMELEKKNIEQYGFPDWDRWHFNHFKAGLEVFATNDYANISKISMEGTKTPEEVRKYSEVFFAKIDTLKDAKKIKDRIQKAQNHVNFNLRAPQIIREKLRQYDNPMEEMVLPQSIVKTSNKFFNRETDVILIMMTHQCGYGNWAKI